MLTRMQQRRGTAAEWADSVISSTVILAAGEVGLETDTGKFKIGNGTSVWSALSYYLKDSQNAGIYAKLAPSSPSYSQNITGINVLSPQSATQTPLVVSGIAGQSAVLQRWRDSADLTLASIDQTGKLTAKGALFNAEVNVNSNKITNVAAPINPADATNKQYVDDAINGLAWKAPVNLVSVSNYALTGTFPGASIDGHAITATQVGYRVLFTAQTTAADKGIYTLTQPTAGNYAFVRSDDSNVYTELKGASVYVQEGTTYGTSSWVQTNHYLTSFSGQTWVQFNGASQITAGSGMTKTGNTLDVIGTANRITANADSIDIASTYVGQSTITTVGALTSGSLATGFTVVGTALGGTGIGGATPFVVGDILYASTTSALSRLASGSTAGYPLLAGGTGVAPSYGQIATGAIANSTSTTTGVTYNKLQYVSAQWRVLGRKTAAAGNVEEMLPDDVISMIGQGTTAISISRIPTGTTGSTVALGNHTHTINDLSDVVITGTPQTRQVIKYNGTNWVNEVPSGGISVGSNPPSQPAAGDAWFDSDDGALYVWYDDAVGSPSAQWVQVKSNSALEASLLTRMSAVESTLLTVSGAAPLSPKVITGGNLYYPIPRGTASTWSTGTGYMALSPIYIPVSCTANRISVNVTSAATAGGIVRLGIYNSDSNDVPTTVLLDAGTVSSTTTGLKEITISQVLSPGLYYLAAVAQVAGCSITADVNGSPLSSAKYTSFPTAQDNGSWNYSPVTGTLPQISAATFWNFNGGTTPRVMLRIA